MNEELVLQEVLKLSEQRGPEFRAHMRVQVERVMTAETAEGFAKIEREKAAPAKWASLALLGCVIALVSGAVVAGALLAAFDWRLAASAVVAICGMGGYVLKEPLSKLIGAVADGIGGS